MPRLRNIRTITAFPALLVSVVILAQQPQKSNKVHLTQAEILKADEKTYGKNVQAVFQNVRFDHQNTILYCDSAYFLRDSNMIMAYSNVHIIQNDSIHLYGDEVQYLGNINMAKVRRNVKMVKGEVTLTTDNLDYDRVRQVGYYFDGGTIVNGQNTLKSDWGFYYPALDEAFFKDSVTLTNPDYTLFSDTLKYHTQTEVAKILGPTFIVSDSNIIYSEDGYYDTKNDYASLLKNSYIQGKQQILKGDVINYNKKTGIGEVFGRMDLNDTVNKVIIMGDYGYYNEITRSALATKKAQLLNYQDGDTLFMHADTLRSDPMPGDSIAKLIRAYHHVRFFRHDLQGLCDSMVYNTVDSTNIMYYEPALWSEGSQMTADKIIIYSKNNKLDRFELLESAFIISPEDSSWYDQIKGRNMVGYIKNNQLFKVDVDGNAQTIYYPKDNEVTIGVNRAECSNMTIYFKERKPVKITMRSAPSGNMNPPLVLPDADVKLQGFIWLETIRPKDRNDIFRIAEIPKSETRKSFDDFIDEGVGNLKPKSQKDKSK